MKRSALLAVLAVASLSACHTTTPDSPDTTEPSLATSASATASTPTEPASPTANRIDADQRIVAELVCEPLSAELLTRMKSDFGTPTRSVQVKVGAGNNPGESWWVVVLDSPADDAYQWGIRQFLTNAQNGEDHWQWIILPKAKDHTWESVQWDQQRLIRAESARIKAHQCLDNKMQ